MLDLDKLDVFYGEVQVWRRVSLSIKKGEVVSLLGSNGAGKTTTVNNVSGVLPLASGSIRLLGEDISAIQPHVRIEKGLMSKPNLLILDEPSLGLAPILFEEIFNVVQRIRSEGVTILLVEQNVPQALSISDRAYVLEEGRVGLSSTGKGLLQNPQIKKLYLGL